MLLFRKIKDVQTKIQTLKNEGKKIGFVPTMGALHEGHLSLISNSKKENDISVCSIFVNPSQFNDPEDFKKYPVTIEKDISLLIKKDIDILFLPSVDEIYPDNFNTEIKFPLGSLDEILEGAFRPGHFQGVCQVVYRLLDIVKPDQLWMGQKDYQQYLVIKKLIDFFHLNVELKLGPTLRQPDGLALSSRNMRLTEEEREKATGLYKALLFIKENAFTHSVEYLKAEAERQIKAAGFNKIEYVEIADAETLQPISSLHEKQKAIVLAAAFLGNVRLIDNMKV